MLLSSSDFCKALKKICWSYLFLHIHINIGTFDLLCDWIGILFILSALDILMREESSAALLRPFACALTLIHLADSVLSLADFSLTEIALVQIITTVLWVYLQFQMLTNIADMAKKREYPSTKRILQLRTGSCVLNVFSMSVRYIDFLQNEFLVIALIVSLLIIVVWTWATLVSLRVYLKENETKEETNA
jgi:hypothetical protein